jgi:hypothetical protein
MPTDEQAQGLPPRRMRALIARRCSLNDSQSIVIRTSGGRARTLKGEFSASTRPRRHLCRRPEFVHAAY